jgi:chromosome segregation ATPase
LAESKRESQILRQDLEDARLEQHRLEDELELRREEIERMNSQIRENQKSKMESQKLAENEVLRILSAFANTSQQQRLLEEKEVLVRSNSELSAQLKTLRNTLQSERSRDTSPSTRDKDSADVSELSSYATTIREKDRQIDSLQLELADLEVRLAEQANAALSRSRQIEEDLIQVKLENIRLAENVESYQILLQDRTLKGEYSIMSVEGLPERDETSSSRSTSPFYDEHKSKGTILATELEEAETSAYSTKIKGSIIVGIR